MTSDRPQRAAAKSKLRMLEPGEVSNYDSVDVETSSDPGNQPAADERLEPGEVENDDSSDSSLPDILDAPPGVVFDHHDGHVTVHHLPSNSRLHMFEAEYGSPEETLKYASKILSCLQKASWKEGLVLPPPIPKPPSESPFFSFSYRDDDRYRSIVEAVSGLVHVLASQYGYRNVRLATDVAARLVGTIEPEMMDDLFSVLTPSEPGLTVLTPPKAPLDYLLDDGRKRRRKPQEHDKYKRRRLGLKESMPDEIEEGEISDDSHSSNDRRRHPPPSWDVSLPTHPSPMPFVYPPTRPPFPIHPVINLPPVLPPPLLPSVSYSPFIVTPPPPPPDVVSESPLLRPDVTELSDISESSGDETDELPLLRPESDRREQGAMTETFCE